MNTRHVVGCLGIVSFSIGFAASLVAQESRPEFFGIYALQDGKLTTVLANPDANDYTPSVRFVVFDRTLRTSGPGFKLFFIPPPKPPAADAGEFKGWDHFLKQSNDLTDGLHMQALYGVPGTAVEIPFRVGPYGDSDEMVRVVPGVELAPGLYQLQKGTRFWVRRTEVQRLYAEGEPVRTSGAQRSSPPSERATRSYPVGSGVGGRTSFAIENIYFRGARVFLNGTDEEISLRFKDMHRVEAEVGSVHLIKVIVGGRTYEHEVTVRRDMRPLRITIRGIEF